MWDVTGTRRVKYWVPLRSAPDAIEAAKCAARDEGFVVATVAKVVYDPREPDAVPAWTVTLAVRSEEAVR